MCNMDKYLWEVWKYLDVLEYSSSTAIILSCGVFSSCTVAQTNCTSSWRQSLCMCECVFGPFSSFKSWSRVPVFNNKSRNRNTEGKRRTNSRNQGTFSHIRLVLHFLCNLTESPLYPIQSYHVPILENAWKNRAILIKSSIMSTHITTCKDLLWSAIDVTF